MDDQDVIPLPEEPGQDPGIVADLQALANAAENAAVARVGQIQMVSVASSDIAAWGYDPVGFRLQIQFTNGRVHIYESVSPIEFEQLTTAPSKGSAFWQIIRRNPNVHPWTRVQ